MAYSNWRGLKGLNYVIHKSGKIVKVCNWTDEGVTFIDSFGNPERYDYSNASRYWLARKGGFPMTKKGDADLKAALDKIPLEHNVLKQQKATEIE